MNVCSLSSELSDILRRNKAVRSPLIAAKRFSASERNKEQGGSLFSEIL